MNIKVNTEVQNPAEFGLEFDQADEVNEVDEINPQRDVAPFPVESSPSQCMGPKHRLQTRGVSK